MTEEQAKIKQRMAEALVEYGYADYQINDGSIRWKDAELDNLCAEIQPFANTFEGRKQLDALYNWLLRHEHSKLMEKYSEIRFERTGYMLMHDIREYMLDCTKWCFEHLEEKPSCFGKKLDVESCYNSCSVSNECYK